MRQARRGLFLSEYILAVPNYQKT